MRAGSRRWRLYYISQKIDVAVLTKDNVDGIHGDLILGGDAEDAPARAPVVWAVEESILLALS
jgi:hypothetical protein